MLPRRIAKEIEKSKHCGIYEPELSRIWPHSGKPREPQIAFFGEQRGLPASLLQGRILRNFSTKGRLPELLFIYSGLSYVSAGRGPRFLLWTASSDPPSCCSDHTQKKSCPQHLHVSLFGLRAYRTRRRSENNPECPCASPTRLSHPLRRLVSLFTHLLLGR